MNKSLIYITAGIAAVGFAVPAFAAHGDAPRHSVPTPVTVATVAPTIATTNTVEDNPARIGLDNSASKSATATLNTVEDNPARIGIDDNGVDDTATVNSVDDNGVDDNGVDDSATVNSVEDNPARIGVDDNGVDDNGVDAGVTSNTVEDKPATVAVDDNSVHGGGADDSGHHSGGDA